MATANTIIYARTAFSFVPFKLPTLFLANLYLLLPSVFLYILAWTLAELLAQNFKEMERVLENAGQDIGGLFLHESVVRHSLVCQAVWKLEEFFSSIMLVNVVCIFISSINFFFLILDGFAKGQFGFAASLIFAVLLRFLLLDAIGRMAERLKNKVHLTKTISKCKLHLKSF